MNRRVSSGYAMLCFDNWAAPASSRWTRRRIPFHLVITETSCQKQKPQSIKWRNGSHGKKGPRQNDKCCNLPETKEKSELRVKLTSQCDATDGRRRQRKDLAENVRMLQCSAAKPSHSNVPHNSCGPNKKRQDTRDFYDTNSSFAADLSVHFYSTSPLPPSAVIAKLRVPAAAAVNHCNIVVVEPPEGLQALPPPGAVVPFQGSHNSWPVITHP